MNNGEFYLADAIEVIDEILAGGGEFRIYPKGTSMLPLIIGAVAIVGIVGGVLISIYVRKKRSLI